MPGVGELTCKMPGKLPPVNMHECTTATWRLQGRCITWALDNMHYVMKHQLQFSEARKVMWS